MVQFAACLGLRQNTISQYESGKITPSAAVLAKIHVLAKRPEHKGAVRALLSDDAASVLLKDETFERTARALTEDLKASIIELQNTPDAQEQYRRLAVAIASGPGGIPLWLCDLMRIWLKVQSNPQALREFEDVVHRARMKLDHFERAIRPKPLRE
jgi:transcriptional regulator with XRE-family HTH domain